MMYYSYSFPPSGDYFIGHNVIVLKIHTIIALEHDFDCVDVILMYEKLIHIGK